MQSKVVKLFLLAFLALVGITTLIPPGRAQKSGTAFTPTIPKTWDDESVAGFEVPLADPRYSPVHVSSDYYYRMPVRSIYKNYPIYAPGKAPPGYMDWLKQQEPEIVFDAAKLKTEADWVRAGELVFDAPIRYQTLSISPLDDPAYYEKTGMLVTKDGTLPYQRYVIRKKGLVEVGGGSCAIWHTRVMPDGLVVKGAQGNFPSTRSEAFGNRRRAAVAADQGKQELARLLRGARVFYSVPWLQPDPGDETFNSLEEFLAVREAIPPGVRPREGTSQRYPTQVPDLIGIKDRRYLDHTGLVRHRSIGDLMRYGAFNQDTQLLGR